MRLPARLLGLGTASVLALGGRLAGAQRLAADTAALLAFRRHVGYALLRGGASRGTRTGEPAAVMVRPVSAAAKARAWPR